MLMGAGIHAGREIARRSRNQHEQTAETTSSNPNRDFNKEQLEAVKAEQRGKNIRRGIAFLAISTLVGGGVYACNKTSETIGKSKPHINATTPAPESVLEEVVLRDDTILVSGSGESTASLSRAAEVCLPLVGCRIVPQTGMTSSVTVISTLDVISEANSVTLRPIQDEAGEWQVEATVAEDGFDTQLSNQTITQNLGESGWFVDQADAIGQQTGQEGMANYVTGQAQQAFESGCATPLVPVIPPAQAESIRNQLQQTAEFQKSVFPEGAEWLREVAERPIVLIYAKGGPQLETPPPVAAQQIKVDNSVFTIEAQEDCRLTPEAVKDLMDAENSPGYQLKVPLNSPE